MDSNWSRRKWIKVVGLSAGALSAGLDTIASALGVSSSAVKRENDGVYVARDELILSREKYANLYGPTAGDKIRLGDTDLIIEIEKDYTTFGDELVFGGGKTARESMGQSSTALYERDKVLDLCITGATVLDYTGIYKADIGIRDGKIVAIGKAGNPDAMDGVTAGMVVGASTELHNGHGMILTAGAIDTHIHFISPTQVETALYSGTTTMIGGGTGPADGTNATTCTPGAWYIQKMLEAAEAFPMNFGYFGKGSSASEATLEEQIVAGALGLKIHEDWGATPAVIDSSLRVADRMDVQITLHTDTLNEAGFIERTIEAFAGRTIHTFHTEGAGGGHAPDIIKVASHPNVLPASTNPTRPYTKNTIAEHLDMLMVCHHLSKKIPEDVAFAESRIRPETIAAEGVLHDMGVLSIMSSDSQAMGRIGEVITRTWQTASGMRAEKGPLSEDKSAGNDNFRAKRYVSKYTINPAIAHGIAHYVGSVEVGKIADLVLWKPMFFGVKPEFIIKGGMIVASRMGDANASIPTPQPIIYQNMFGAYGKAKTQTCFNFVSKASLDKGIIPKYGLQRTSLPVKNCRDISKKSLKFNDKTPRIDINAENYKVHVDGKLVSSNPMSVVPLAQRYYLF